MERFNKESKFGLQSFFNSAEFLNPTFHRLFEMYSVERSFIITY